MWAAYLDPGETILWQGKPDARFVITFKAIGLTLGNMGALLFVAVWMALAAGMAGPAWIFGLVFVFSILKGIVTALAWDPFRRRYTRYALSTKRAFIAVSLPFRQRSLTTYPITSDMVLELKEARLGSLIFNPAPELPDDYQAGFERITDAGHVHALIRQIQRGNIQP